MDCGKRSVDRLPTNQDRSAGTSGRTASAVGRGRNLGRPEIRLAGKLGATAQRKRYRCCGKQRENRVRGQAERAERAVSRVLANRRAIRGRRFRDGRNARVRWPPPPFAVSWGQPSSSAITAICGAAGTAGTGICSIRPRMSGRPWNSAAANAGDTAPNSTAASAIQAIDFRRRSVMSGATQYRRSRGWHQTARIFSGCASVRRSRRALPRSVRASPASCPPSRTSA